MPEEVKPPEPPIEEKPPEKPSVVSAPAPKEVPPAVAPATQKKRIEVDEEEFEGMKKRLKEIEGRRKGSDAPPAPAPAAQKKRPIDRLHRGIFGR